MKRTYILLVFSWAYLICLSQNAISNQEKLANDIYQVVVNQGYETTITGRQIDFTYQGYKCTVSVDSIEESPFYVEFYIDFRYSDVIYTKENLLSILAKLNRQKGVKVTCFKDVFSLQSNMFVSEAKHFTSVLPKMLTNLKTSLDEMKKLLKANNSDNPNPDSAIVVENNVPTGTSMTPQLADEFAEAYKLYQQREYDVAMPLFKKLSERDYGPAYAYMGLAHEFGYHYTKDIDVAIQYYRKAMSANVEKWIGYRLGNLEYKRENYANALEGYQYTTADKSSNWFPEACEKVGKMYEDGRGTQADLTKASLYYKSAALKGNRSAIRAVQRLNIELYTMSDFTPGSPSLTSGLSTKEMIDKGDRYCDSFIGTKYNLPLAYKYYLAACNQGDVAAYEKMGDFCSENMLPDELKMEAEKWYRKALYFYMEHAEEDTEAAYESGYYHQFGLGTAKNIKTALKYYRIAASKEYGAAYWRIGELLDAQGDYKEAFDYLLIGAQHGFCYSMMLVAKYYENGIGCKKNIAQAIYWYKKANSSMYATEWDARVALERLGVNTTESGD